MLEWAPSREMNSYATEGSVRRVSRDMPRRNSVRFSPPACVMLGQSSGRSLQPRRSRRESGEVAIFCCSQVEARPSKQPISRIEQSVPPSAFRCFQKLAMFPENQSAVKLYPLGNLPGRRRGGQCALNLAEVEQRLHGVVRRAAGDGERLAQIRGGVGLLANAEKQDTEIYGGVVMGGRQQQGAAQGSLGDVQLNHAAIVRQFDGFPSQDRVREHGGGFDDLTFEKETGGGSPLAAWIRIGERDRGVDCDQNGLRRF